MAEVITLLYLLQYCIYTYYRSTVAEVVVPTMAKATSLVDAVMDGVEPHPYPYPYPYP